MMLRLKTSVFVFGWCLFSHFISQWDCWGIKAWCPPCSWAIESCRFSNIYTATESNPPPSTVPWVNPAVSLRIETAPAKRSPSGLPLYQVGRPIDCLAQVCVSTNDVDPTATVEIIQQVCNVSTDVSNGSLPHGGQMSILTFVTYSVVAFSFTAEFWSWVPNTGN